MTCESPSHESHPRKTEDVSSGRWCKLIFRLWITETGEEICSRPTHEQSYIDICKKPFIWLPPRPVAHGRHQTLSWRHVCSLWENDTPAVTGFLLLPEAVSTGLVFPPQSRKTNFLRNKPGEKKRKYGRKNKTKAEKKTVMWINGINVAPGLGDSVSLRDDRWCRERGLAPLKDSLLIDGVWTAHRGIS